MIDNKTPDAANVNKDVIDWIQHILDRKQWTGTDLARKSNLAPSTILRILNNPSHRFLPSLRTLTKISEGSGYPIPRKLVEQLNAQVQEEGQDPHILRMAASRSQEAARETPVSTPAPAAKARNLRVQYVSALPETLHPKSRDEVFVPATPQLESDDTAFAFYVPESGLEPFVSAGSLAYATKRRDPKKGDLILITNADGRSKVRVVSDISERGIEVADGKNETSIVEYDDIRDIAVVAMVSRL